MSEQFRAITFYDRVENDDSTLLVRPHYGEDATLVVQAATKSDIASVFLNSRQAEELHSRLGEFLDRIKRGPEGDPLWRDGE